MPTKPDATTPPRTRVFCVPKSRARELLALIQELQTRDDLSGKFTRKLGRVRRKLTKVDQEIVAEVNDVESALTRRDQDGNAIPVFELDDAGKPKFRRDERGQETDEPIVIPGRFHLTDPVAYAKELEDLAKERIRFTCEVFTTEEIDDFKRLKGTIGDAMTDLSEESEFLVTEEEPSAAAPRVPAVATEGEGVE